nr:probable G-protein coupled receptor No18 isoform X3 [Procambarus clarkii]
MSGKNHTADVDDEKDLSIMLPIWEMVVTGFSLTIIIIFTILSNVLVIVSVFTYRPLRKVQNFFIVSLAVADLMMAVFVMPFNVAYIIIGKWVVGKYLCEMYLTSITMCCTASIFNLCAIALDRYWAITDPVNYAQKRTIKRMLIMIILVWAISFVISFPPLLGWNDWPDDFTEESQCFLSQKADYVVYSAVGSFFCPLVLIVIIYIKIYKATKRRLRMRAQGTKLKKLDAIGKIKVVTLINSEGQGPEGRVSRSVTPFPTARQSEVETSITDIEESNQKPPATTGNLDEGVTPQTDGSVISKFIADRQRISLTQERRLVRTLTIIMGCFVGCWLPFVVMYLILPFCPSCQELDMRIFDFIQWLSYVNSAFNPVIYTVFNKDFRTAFICMKKSVTRRLQEWSNCIS